MEHQQEPSNGAEEPSGSEQQPAAAKLRGLSKQLGERRGGSGLDWDQVKRAADDTAGKAEAQVRIKLKGGGK